MGLKHIREELEGYEAYIIFHLMSRAQLPRNDGAYHPGKSGFEDQGDKSALDLRLEDVEWVDAIWGRYTDDDEIPFTTTLPNPERLLGPKETHLHPAARDAVNVSQRILREYQHLLSGICAEGDDPTTHGLTVKRDVQALQVIAHRIHHGAMFVAEAKFLEDPDAYTALIADVRDGRKSADDILAKLTRSDKEKEIRQRVADTIHGLHQLFGKRFKNEVKPAVVADYFLNNIIPATKEGEVQYLLHRT